MQWKQFFWVASMATVFFFLPSLAVKLWETLLFIPWQYQRWLVYPVVGWLIWVLARRRWRRMATPAGQGEEALLDIAKRRLVKGEVTLEEFRQIREELKSE
ncbi:MAG TPA: hypothetical protein VEC37_12320 [Bacillota bacterium]|nr:hypothetical protein [Bacillota bacterium]